MVKNIWPRKSATKATIQHNQHHAKNIEDSNRFPNYNHDVMIRCPVPHNNKHNIVDICYDNSVQRQCNNARVNMANQAKHRAMVDTEVFPTNSRPRRSSDIKDRQRQCNNARVDMPNYAKHRAMADTEVFYTNPRPRRSSDVDRKMCIRDIPDVRRRRS